MGKKREQVIMMQNSGSSVETISFPDEIKGHCLYK